MSILELQAKLLRTLETGTFHKVGDSKPTHVKASRIARARNISENAINTRVAEHIEQPLFRLFGPEKINVLRLNIALDQLK